MNGDLSTFTRQAMAASVADDIGDFAHALAIEYGASAALFYGSALRTGDRDGILDFYLLTEAPHRKGLRGLIERMLWPEVDYCEGEGGLRAKIAVMTLEDFGRAARNRTLDTTIWARFVQPTALVWAARPEIARQVEEAVAGAAATAARYAAAVGPAEGTPADFWRALFRRTYRAEFRVEKADRADQVIAFEPEHYAALLPLAWAAKGIVFDAGDGILRPRLPAKRMRRLKRAFRRQEWFGKPLNIARLAKASFTFTGAARYAAWKIERHTGVAVPLSPWMERFPILAAPGVLWRLAKASRRKA